MQNTAFFVRYKLNSICYMKFVFQWAGKMVPASDMMVLCFRLQRNVVTSELLNQGTWPQYCLKLFPLKKQERPMCVYCEVGARSCNRYCRGKVIPVTYSECVFVALIIQHAKRMRPIILACVACPSLQYFSTLSHKQHDFWEKNSYSS